MNNYKFCVYKIVNKINGHRYFGSTDDVERRKTEHFGLLYKNKHHSSYLQNAYNKYGPENFELVVFLICNNREEAFEDEQLCLDHLNPEYNMSRIASYPTKETRIKISNSLIGHKNGIGIPCSPSRRARISRSMTGNKNAVGNKSNTGRSQGEQHRKNIERGRLRQSIELSKNPTYGVSTRKNCDIFVSTVCGTYLGSYKTQEEAHNVAVAELFKRLGKVNVQR